MAITVSTQLEPDEHTELRVAAAKRGHSLASWATVILRKALEDERKNPFPVLADTVAEPEPAKRSRRRKAA